MKRLAFIVAFLLTFAMSAPARADGFDQYGYNRTARVFVGTMGSWCAAKGIPQGVCVPNYAYSLSDQLVMKWNAEWDRGNLEKWNSPPYRAYLDNELNGNVPGGSGWTEHFKTVWVGPCGQVTLPSDSYCIWGQFAAIFDRGMDPDHVSWIVAHATPAGYGSYP